MYLLSTLIHIAQTETRHVVVINSKHVVNVSKFMIETESAWLILREDI